MSQSPQQQKLNIALSLDEVNAIIQQFGRLPFNESAGFISNLQKQATAQLQALQNAAKETVKEESATKKTTATKRRTSKARTTRKKAATNG